MSAPDPYAWWASLKHGGLLIAPSKLPEFLPATHPPLAPYAADRLRRDVTRADASDGTGALLKTVLEDVVGLGQPLRADTGQWRKGSDVGTEWTHRAITGEAIKPRQVWFGERGATLPVFVDDAPRLGVGRGRRPAARVVEWLRRAGKPAALLTNGRQWRLVHAGLDYDAFAEADTALWFEQGEPGPQVTALRILLSPAILTPPAPDATAPLLAAIEASRKGQAELSADLGERARRAVELLIQEVWKDAGGGGQVSGTGHQDSDSDTRQPAPDIHPSIYLAAARVVMRMVVVLFAEARDLLPRDNPIYHGSYGLQGLREGLDSAGGGAGHERLRHRYGAWPRVLSLFRLVYAGSPHEALPVPRYGGGLFEPGDGASSDAIRRALVRFEDPEHGPSDTVVREVLTLLCRARVRVRQGKGATWVDAPVDFSDLSSEYIGILYEGLLDYELRRSGTDNPIVFLALGDEPALPLSRLEAMTDTALPALVEKFKVKVKAGEASDDAEEEEAEADEESTGDAQDTDEADASAPSPASPAGEGRGEGTDSADEVAPAADLRHQTLERARAWARRAVIAGKLVPKPKSKKADAQARYDTQVDQVAAGLISRVVLPGEWFLVRWGGTRKGAGTFYTRPPLAVPTVQRTLRPLMYQEAATPIGEQAATPSPANSRERAGVREPLSFSGGSSTTDAPPNNCSVPSPQPSPAGNAGEGVSTLQSAEREGDAPHPVAVPSATPSPANSRERAGVRGRTSFSAVTTTTGTAPDNCSVPSPQPSPAGNAGEGVLAEHPVGAGSWGPVKTPEEILALKVCDPAMGSGSMLVAALRFLTDALFESLFAHDWLRRDDDRLAVAADARSKPPWFLELVREMPVDVEEAERYVRARLKRYVVERCVYGVDFDPLAVELARLSLWVETMDKTLPFEFLDHKLKAGNSLVGCWFDYFRDYPALAWDREGGDKNHTNGVHFAKEAWTKAIRQFRNGRIKAELIDWIQGQRSLLDIVEGRSPEAVHDEALAALEEMHALPVHESEARAAFYRERILGNPALARLREAFDTWCAIWFWPADQLEDAPTPRTFENPSERTREIVRELKGRYRFFHWELEFPDVFAAAGAGFDAVVGNPPWETQKPNSMEFFSNLDPLYRTYGKQDALRRQRECFESSAFEESTWVTYNARFKFLSNWNRSVAAPFGDGTGESPIFNLGPGGRDLHARWQTRRGWRRGYADREHPFRHQGSADINTYKMFLEQARALLRDGGALGMLVPSGIYSDKGSGALRSLFLDRCRWHHLYAFQNERFVFAGIHHSFKIAVLSVAKGGCTMAIRTRFRLGPGDSPESSELAADIGNDPAYLSVPANRIAQFSPRTRSLLEVRSRRDLEVLEKIYANAVLLGDDGPDGWGIKYATEFHMTNDSKLFPPRPWWEERGYVPDIYGRWIKFRGRVSEAGVRLEVGWIPLRDRSGVVQEGDIEDVALPLYEGRMIGQFDFSQKGWVSGKGRKAVWREIPWDSKVIEPQYLMAAGNYIRERPEAAAREGPWEPKLSFMDITSATNERTMIASVAPRMPFGNSVPLLRTPEPPVLLGSVLVSFCYDYAVRARCGGLHLNFFVIEESPLPRRIARSATRNALALNAPSILFAPDWLRSRANALQTNHAWRAMWALTDLERIRSRCILDAVVAEAYGLRWDELAWVLRDCDHPAERVRDKAFARTLDPKGFWRVDKDKDPELRHTVLTLVAFRDLQQLIADCGGDRDRAIAAFCGVGGSADDPTSAPAPRAAFLDADGWQLPETLCLADYGLGHDERARKPQPVRERLGPRFYDWQLAQSVEESWRECEIHARNILGEDGYARLQAEMHGEGVGDRVSGADKALPAAAEGPAQYGLFGDGGTSAGRGRRRRR